MTDLLLIDDDRELCELLASWLQQEGFSVRACHDGASARSALAEPAPLARSAPITDEPTTPPAPATTPATDPWARPAGLRRDATVARTTNALASAPDTEAWQTGNQLLASGQWWPAIAAYQRAYAHTPDPALAHNLALALTAAGEHVAAQHWQQRAGEHP